MGSLLADCARGAPAPFRPITSAFPRHFTTHADADLARSAARRLRVPRSPADAAAKRRIQPHTVRDVIVWTGGQLAAVGQSESARRPRGPGCIRNRPWPITGNAATHLMRLMGREAQ